VAHREQVLAAAKEQNARLVAELAHTRTMVLQGQYAAEAEVGGSAALAKAAVKNARRQRQHECLQKQRHLHIIRDQNLIAAPTMPGGLEVGTGDLPEAPHGTTTTAITTNPPHAHSPSYQRQLRSLASPTTSDRESTPRRRSSDTHHPRSGRSPLGKALLSDATVTKEIRLCQEIKKLQRATEEECLG